MTISNRRIGPDAPEGATLRLWHRLTLEEVSQPDERPDLEAVLRRCGVGGPDRTHRTGPAERSGGWYSRTQTNLAAVATELGHRFARRIPGHPLLLMAAASISFSVTAVLVLRHHWTAAAASLMIAGMLEAADAGAATESAVSRRSVFLDYFMDRVADVVLLVSLTLALWSVEPTAAWLAAVLLVTSQLSSYARAQAEALRFSSSARFGRAERLVLVWVALAGTALLPSSSGVGHVLLLGGLLLAIGITIVTLAQRLLSVRGRPYVELAMRWDDESFLPRLIESLTQDEAVPVALVSQSGAGKDGRTSHLRAAAGTRQVIYVDKQANGTARVRIVDSA